jgi:hypothetical protein
MVGVISGSLAMVHRTDHRPYAEGLHFLARTVQHTLCLAYFYRRLANQIAEGILRGIDHEQARFSQIACFTAIVVDVAKLLEDRKDSWNLVQLHKEWRKYVPDPTKREELMAAIDDLAARLAWVQGRRHNKEAHQTKADELTTFTALPPTMDSVSDVVRVLDMFVDGTIPYRLHLHDSGEDIDLRAEFAL